MKRSSAGIVLLSAVLGAIGCGVGSYEDVSRPALVVTIAEEGGFCTAIYVVDGEDAVWSGGGCGEATRSLQRTGARVAASERASLEAAMDEVLALPDDAECDLTRPSGRSYRFIRTLSGGGADEARQCQPGVPFTATRLAEQLEALGGGAALTDAGPSDAGGP